MIKPTIGRVMWYWPTKQSAEVEGYQAYAALVVFVHNDQLVNLAVFDRNGDCRSRTNVPLFQAGVGEERPDEPHCEWMPLQKGQAAKVESGIDSNTLHSRLVAVEKAQIDIASELASIRQFIGNVAKDVVAKQGTQKDALSQPTPPATNAGTPVPPLASSNSTNTVPRAG